jgi:hypothetical protein
MKTEQVPRWAIFRNGTRFFTEGECPYPRCVPANEAAVISELRQRLSDGQSANCDVEGWVAQKLVTDYRNILADLGLTEDEMRDLAVEVCA